MARCDACGSWVTSAYKRVFSSGGRLASCQNCTRMNVKSRDEYVPPRGMHVHYESVPGEPDG